MRMRVSDLLGTFVDQAVGTPRCADFWNQLIDRGFQPIHSYTLSQLLRSGDVDFSGPSYLFLRRVNRNLYPTLKIRTENDWMNFRLFTVLWIPAGPQRPNAIGVRFETDEGTGGGAHDFCHAQLFTTLPSLPRPPIPGWIPQSQPSIPLDADDQIGTVLCALIAIYGASEVMKRLNTQDIKGLADYKKSIRALRAPRGKASGDSGKT